MARLAQTAGLTDDPAGDPLHRPRRSWTRRSSRTRTALEHADTYPQDIVDGMKEMGLFGLTIPEEFGGLGESLLTYALVVEQIARGWMSVSGVINTHFIVAHMIAHHGTEEQKQRYLPRMATGEVRGSFSMSEPELGSDVAAIKTRAVADGDDYVIDGAEDVADQRRHVQPHRGAGEDRRGRGEGAPEPDRVPGGEADRASARSRPGLTIPGKIDKMGYKGVDTTEMVFDGYRIAGRPDPGRRAAAAASHQMMDGVEVGRVNVAARACGISIRAFELAVDYAQQRAHVRQADRRAPGDRVQARRDGHQGRGRAPDDGQRRAAEGLRRAQRRRGRHGQAAGVSEYCAEVTQESFRIHGGYGYSKEYEIERLMREAPFLLIGEGTSEIQKTIISRGLLKEYRLR